MYCTQKWHWIQTQLKTQHFWSWLPSLALKKKVLVFKKVFLKNVFLFFTFYPWILVCVCVTDCHVFDCVCVRQGARKKMVNLWQAGQICYLHDTRCISVKIYARFSKKGKVLFVWSLVKECLCLVNILFCILWFCVTGLTILVTMSKFMQGAIQCPTGKLEAFCKGRRMAGIELVNLHSASLWTTQAMRFDLINWLL